LPRNMPALHAHASPLIPRGSGVWPARQLTLAGGCGTFRGMAVSTAGRPVMALPGLEFDLDYRQPPGAMGARCDGLRFRLHGRPHDPFHSPSPVASRPCHAGSQRALPRPLFLLALPLIFDGRRHSATVGA
jgi:hypothetical protein